LFSCCYFSIISFVQCKLYCHLFIAVYIIGILFVMFRCYACGHCEPTVAKFRAHLQRHHIVGELSYPILCSDCKSSFATIYNFMRHVTVFHSDTAGCGRGMVSGAQSDSYMECSSENDSSVESVTGTVTSDTFGSTGDDYANLFGNVRAEGISLVAGLRANSSIPFSVVPAVVQSFNNMSSSLVSLVQAETLQSLVSSGVDRSVIANVKSHLDSKLRDSMEPLDFLSTRYKQDRFFDSHQMAVKPETVSFGTNFTSHGGTSRLVYETFQYVPVAKTLQSLMQNKGFVEMMLHDKCVPGTIQDFVDGEKYRTHHLFSDCSKVTLMIQLFYDGLGVTNPLRGHSTLHNVGVFYYTIKNIPHQHNSCFANVHLLALCYSEDLKKYGFGPVLEKFVAEMNTLSEIGFVGTFPVIGEQTIYASLCQVTCDNLALNGILGFIESFSCDYFCTICYATQDEIQTHFREEFFQRRTLHEYNQDVQKLRQGADTNRKHIRGVKTDCALNQIEGYHVTSNCSLDIMHVVLEGILPVELGCILHGLCMVDKVISFETLNRELQIFWGKITVEKTHKPLQLNRLLEPGQGLSPTMKALQYWTLLKYLPVIFGNLAPAANTHWHFLLHLSHLVDMLFCPRFTLGMISYMRSTIEDHLAMFLSIYGSNGAVRLRPKHHLLIHLPSIVLQSGPLIGMSCLRYELKNSFLKRSAHIVCNFTNICHTLAYRHQQRALFSLLSNAHCRTVPTVTHHKMVVVSNLEYGSLLCDKLGVVCTECVSVAVKLSVASVQYKQDDYVIIDAVSDTDSLIFGRIVNFVACSHSEEWYIAVESLETVKYWTHFHAYHVCAVRPVAYRVLAVSEMIDHHPLYCHSTVVDGVQQRFIRIPYHIFKP